MPNYRAKPLGGRAAAAKSPRTGDVDLAPLRRAFEESDLSLTDIARILGWMRPDQPRVGRALGYHRDHGRLQTHCTTPMALKLAEVLDVDPVDLGC